MSGRHKTDYALDRHIGHLRLNDFISGCLYRAAGRRTGEEPKVRSIENPTVCIRKLAEHKAKAGGDVRNVRD
jgi:hypothetical protein